MDEDTSPSENTSEIPIEVDGFEPPQEEVVPVRRVDYEETFSPIADIRAIRILIAIVALYDYEIWQMDVKTTFLNCASKSEEVKRMENVPYASAVGSIMYEDTFLVYGGNPEAELRLDCYRNVGFKTNRDDIKSQTG
ncbi:retrotransposon protein, putative, ty1-copia subclass [Tanacetum coccineum]